MKPRQAKWSPEQLVVVSAAAAVAWGGSLLPETSAIQLRNLQRSYSFFPALSPSPPLAPSCLLRFASCVKTFGSVCSSSSIKLHEANKVIFIAHTQAQGTYIHMALTHTHTPCSIYRMFMFTYMGILSLWFPSVLLRPLLFRQRYRRNPTRKRWSCSSIR